MTGQRTKQEMREQMEAGLAKLLMEMDRLSADQMTGPADAAGWTARDHLTHLAAWADGIAALLQRKNRWLAMGIEMDDPAGEEPANEVMNAQIAQKNRHLSPAGARAWLVDAHKRVVEAMEALDESELSLPYERFVSPFTSNWGQSISEYILGNTAEHYEEHTGWIRAIADTS